MIDQKLLEILRCPACVSGPSRREGPDPGRLELIHDVWLVCQEPDCGRKYPIHDGIPIMLIEEGDKHRHTPLEQLEQP
ncbi:MAG: Trm112 family protein [Chloroflexota bacterium]